MDPTKHFGAFQQQIKKNQEELTDYLKELDSWKDSIAKKDEALKSGTAKDEKANKIIPPVRTTQKKKRRVKDANKEGKSKEKPKKISGFDFRAWDKFDVDKALEDVDRQDGNSSSYEEETDEEWEEERLKQQANFEKELGNDYFKKGKFDEAISCYTKGISCDPTNAVLYANRAMALLKQDKFGAVESDCTDALVLDPTYVKAYMRRATARYKLKKLTPALQDYKQVLKLEPENKMAKREVEVLELELENSSLGVVLPIKKPVKDRSKKPLVRINIQDIDQGHVTSQLKEVVTMKQPKQNDTKAKPTEETLLSGSRVPLIKDITEESSNSSLNSATESPRDESQSTEKPILSPADIGRLKSKPTKPRTDCSNSSSPQESSPHTEFSLKAPVNSFQFQRDWKAVKNDLDASYDYLKMISPVNYPKLFGESLESKVLVRVMNVFLERYLRDGVNVSEHLFKLAEVKRFSMTVMLLSSSEQTIVKKTLEKLAELPDIKNTDISKLKSLYQL